MAEEKAIKFKEDGTLDKFCVSPEVKDLIMALDKHHEWIKEQTLSKKLSLHISIPDEKKMIVLTW